MKIVDYKIVWSSQLTDLDKYVNDCIKDGWTPIGGAFSASDHLVGTDIYGVKPYHHEAMCQTMVKYAD